LDAPGGVTVTPSFFNCTGIEDDPCQSMLLTFLGTPFVLGDKLDYTIGVCSKGEDDSEEGSCERVSSNDLAGGTYQYQFSDGYQTISLLTASGTNLVGSSSWDADQAITGGIGIYDLNLLIAADTGRLPCTLDPVTGSCPSPLDTGIEDGDPREEGGQPVPEPPSIPIFLAGLGFALLLYHCASQRQTAV
jgi:hypothetical protein